MLIPFECAHFKAIYFLEMTFTLRVAVVHTNAL